MVVGKHHSRIPQGFCFIGSRIIRVRANGRLSALQLSRDLGVNRNTALRVFKQICKAMLQAEHRGLLIGIAELEKSDEYSESNPYW